jgi:hypothetical protein
MQLITKTLDKMKILLISSLLISVLTSSCQVHWDNTTDWKLYRYQGNELFSISLDSLHSFQNITLAKDSMNNYLSGVTIKHPKAATRWMGGYIATCQSGGASRKVVISNYGGFFYDQKAGAYYQLPTEKIDDWLSFLQTSYMTMIKKGD